MAKDVHAKQDRNGMKQLKVVGHSEQKLQVVKMYESRIIGMFMFNESVAIVSYIDFTFFTSFMITKVF